MILITSGGLHIFREDFLSYLAGFHFSGDIYAIPEGSVVFPKEPAYQGDCADHGGAACGDGHFKYRQPPEPHRDQSVAGGLRCRRRRHGVRPSPRTGDRTPVHWEPELPSSGGCTGTSNVLAGELFGIPVQGTHAHAWIMSFPDEYTAFHTYANMYPDACILLVDTYDTLKSGVPNAIRVFKEMREKGISSKLYGIRLDSGDLAYLSKKARKMLDEAGFTDAIISASSDLDEYLIDSLRTQGAAITSWGVGTNLITSADNPAFGGVYKLAAIKKQGESEFTAKIKISENPEKITNPGNKTIFRIYDNETHKIKADLICLVGETYDTSEDLKIFDPISTWKKSTIPGGTYTMRELLVPVFLNGQCVYESPDTMSIKAVCQQELDTLWDENRRLVNPQTVYVDLSQPLFDLKRQLLEDGKQ